MKISLTLIFTLLMIFLTSCNSAPSSSMQQKIINLNVETNDKNKELIIESLLTNKQKFNINFQDDNSYLLENNVLNSELKYFCKSFLDDQKDLLEKSIFQNKGNKDKNVLVIFSEEQTPFVNKLKKKYPNEDYYLIRKANFEIQIKKLLDIGSSSSRFLKLSQLDKNIEISHTPRIKNNISNIYFLMNYEIGKTIVPFFRSYAINLDFYSSTEIFHDDLDFKKLLDFEKTYVPITDKMIKNLSNKNSFNLQDNIAITLINDYIEIEKIYQHNLFRENFIPSSGNKIVKKNNCVKRDLNLWQISSDNFIQI